MRRFAAFDTEFVLMAVASNQSAKGATGHSGTSADDESLEAQQGMNQLVRSLAGRIVAGLPRGCGIELSDLIQAGNIGLIQAIRSFSPHGGVPLAGYARFRIRGEMLDTVRRNAGRGSASAAFRQGASCDDMELENSVPSSIEDSPLRLLATSQRAAILGEEIDRLPPQHRTVVRLRYSRDFSLREIGAVLKVNESRACQIHRSALFRLRRALSNRGVRGLWQLI
jgi:RNA polymerase sigma factor for flagellar operon FliA